MKISKSLCSSLLLGAIAVGLGVVVAILLWLPKNDSGNNRVGNNSLPDLGCISSIEEKIVRGNSLTGLIEPGETVKILFGYYDCNEIRREDVIIYSYAGSSNPLIKIVKGIPGDKFTLQTESGWYILINKKILKNSKNQPYVLDERGYRMLSLYEKDYAGTIPKDAYLILGNLTNGATDSTRYGLVHKTDILGKAEANYKQ